MKTISGPAYTCTCFILQQLHGHLCVCDNNDRDILCDAEE